MNVTAPITKDRITVSPKRFGAGPVVLLVANETTRAHRVTIESDQLGASSPGIRQNTPASARGGPPRGRSTCGRAATS